MVPAERSVVLEKKKINNRDLKTPVGASTDTYHNTPASSINENAVKEAGERAFLGIR